MDKPTLMNRRLPLYRLDHGAGPVGFNMVDTSALRPEARSHGLAARRRSYGGTPQLRRDARGYGTVTCRRPKSLALAPRGTYTRTRAVAVP